MTLTLPGIAGMILTIGVAADANVVIFERIKEEVRRGKTVRSAVNSGYARGFKTILDANILTMLTAARAVPVRHGRPKGFAFTLIIGVLVSMLTAVLFTRAMLGVLAGFAFFNKPSFMGVKAGQIDIETAVMGDTPRRRLAQAARRRAGEPAPKRRRRPPPSPPPPAAPSTATASGRPAPHVDHPQAQEAEIARELLPPHLLVRLHGPQDVVVHHLRHHHRRRPHQPVRQGRRQPRRRPQLRARVQGGHAHRGRLRAAADAGRGARRSSPRPATPTRRSSRRPTSPARGQAGFQIQTARARRRRSRRAQGGAGRAVHDRRRRTARGLQPRDRGRHLRQPGRQLVAQGRRARPAPHPHLRHVPLPVEVRRRRHRRRDPRPAHRGRRLLAHRAGR